MAEAHPLFDRIARERGFFSEELMAEVARHGGVRDIDAVPDEVRAIFPTAHDVTPAWHVRMQAAFQDHVDNAVSKTVNFSNAASPEEVEEVYLLAYELGAKGVTIYRDGSRSEQVLNIGEVKRAAGGNGNGAGHTSDLAATYTVAEGFQGPCPCCGSHVLPARGSRGGVLRGETREKVTGCGSLYVTINEDDAGPREVFANMGKAGGCSSASTEALGRMISLAFRYGAPPDKIAKQLKGIRCHVPLGFGPNQVLSCPDAIGKALAEKYADPEALPVVETDQGRQLEMPIAYAQGACPDCGGAIEHEGGCMVCRSCGFSRCS
jgi:ribonucleoside-diphosphate reductase alpha chain